MITPYTSSEVMAITNSRPALMLASATSGPKGITAHAASAGMMVMMGPSRNRPLLATVGRMISLVISLSASAIGCSRPSGPMRFGPTRICVKPMALRSHSVRYATASISGITTTMILISVQTTGQTTDVHQPAATSPWPKP
ncbi:hypothetical protein FQZ97_650060 [compost metagenome]